MNKEAIELLEEAKHQGCSGHCVDRINQVLAILKEQPPAGDFTKKCREIINKWGCLDNKESKELCDRLDRSEAENKELKVADKTHLSAYNGLQERYLRLEAQLKAKDELLFAFESVRAPKQLPARESDDWMKSTTEFYALGGCPICFSTDEAGCTEGCYLGQLQSRLDRSEAISKIKDKQIAAFEAMVKAGGECCDILQERIDILSEGKQGD